MEPQAIPALPTPPIPTPTMPDPYDQSAPTSPTVNTPVPSIPEPIQPPDSKMSQKLLIPSIILLVIAIVLVAFKLILTKKVVTPPQPTPTTLSQPTPSPTPDPTTGWKTYTNTKTGFELKYPQGKIVEESVAIPNNGLQTTIDLGGVNLLILKRSDINPVTNLPYKSLAEFDPRVSSFSSFTLNELNAKDSGQYNTQAGTTQRDIILMKDANIWIIQEISLQKDVTVPFDQILSTFKFLE